MYLIWKIGKIFKIYKNTMIIKLVQKYILYNGIHDIKLNKF